MVHQCGELFLLILLCVLMYELQLTAHTFPALRLERVLLLLVPLGQRASLHLLRSRRIGSDFVRRLLRYYHAVRLPMFVHHRLVPFGFPMRTLFLSNRVELGLSRFPCVESLYMYGVSDHAEL